MGKTYVEPGKAALTGVFTPRQGGVSYGNFDAEDFPIETNDLTEGYAPGSLWYYTTRSQMWVCLDAAEGAAVWENLSEASKVTILCRNNTGSTITKGSIVYVTGALGDHPTIALADKDSETTSSRSLGMVVADIADNDDGFVAVNGTVEKLNTNSYAAGTPLWLGDNGGWTATKPVPPAHSVFVGWVVRQNTNNGRVVLHIQNGYELDELHDVLLDDPPADGDVLTYETSSGLWKNKPASGGGVEVLSTFLTDVSASNTTADAFSSTVGANQLDSNGDMLRLRGTLEITGTVGSITMTATFGGNPAGSLTTTTNGTYDIEVRLIRTGSDAYRWVFAGSAGVTSNSYGEEMALSGLFASSRTFKVAISTTSATRTVTARFGTVEFLPAL